ncbi:MAG: GNAT family N-acetyltransferase [Pseudomonadota bacterium]
MRSFAAHLQHHTLGVLLGWKSIQLAQSGLLDVTRAGGAGDVLQTIAAQETPECWGYLIQLRLDGKVIAGQFGLRCQNTFHPWIAAYDPAQAAISPGNLLLRDALMEMEALGLKRYDLAGGHDHYKKYYANQSVRTVSGFVSAPSVSGWMQSFSRSIWSLFGAPGARLERRFDHIAASELRLNRRLAEVFKAVRAGLFSGPRQIGHTPAKTERSS